MVRTSGMNQHGETVLSYVRWVMVKKRDTSLAAPETVWPDMAPRSRPPKCRRRKAISRIGKRDTAHTFFEDYQAGMKISHGDGTTLEEAEHMLATRLYQNNAAVHFDAHCKAKAVSAKG